MTREESLEAVPGQKKTAFKMLELHQIVIRFLMRKNGHDDERLM